MDNTQTQDLENILGQLKDKLIIKPIDLPALDINFAIENDKIAMIIKRKLLDPKKEISINATKFFSKTFDLPSNDPELVKLRDEYFRELKILEEKKGGCKPCDKGALMRKYLPRISKYYDA